MTTHFLRWNESPFCYVAFDVSKDQVSVIGLMSASIYIDRKMSIVEARSFWKRLVSEGWHHEVR